MSRKFIIERLATPHTVGSPPFGSPTLSVRSGNERQIGAVDLEDGGQVRIVCAEEIETEEALEWAEDIIQRKRRELAKRKERLSSASVGDRE